MTKISAIFLNLPIKNLKKSVDFFSGLGFTFNAQFTAEDSTCMIVGENIFVMLVEEAKFQGFLAKPIADPRTTEVLLSLSCASKDEVNFLAETAFSLGGKKVNEPEDHGFMYSWGFEDLDGHVWDLFWMDPAHIQ
jgi:predicted lactoylglutathione lyase